MLAAEARRESWGSSCSSCSSCDEVPLSRGASQRPGDYLPSPSPSRWRSVLLFTGGCVLAGCAIARLGSLAPAGGTRGGGGALPQVVSLDLAVGGAGAEPVLLLGQPEILRKLDHDATSFTEGLEALPDGKGFIESAGLYQQSKLFAYNEDDELYSCGVDRSVFGEGITVLGDKLYQLTYKERDAFVYDLGAVADCDAPQVLPGVILQFDTKEGWGMTNDGEKIIAGDGSSKLYFLEPGSMKVNRTLVIAGQDPVGRPITNVNELEYVDGLIYFNVWLTSFIGIYNVSAEKVVAWMSLKELVLEEKSANPGADVLNGLAFTRPEAGAPRKLVVTGKLWQHMYELDHEPFSGGHK